MANETALSKGFPSGGSDFDPLFQSNSTSGSSSTHYYNLDDSTTSDLSAVNQTGLMFMSHDQLEAIATAIQPSQPLHVKTLLDTNMHVDYWLMEPENERGAETNEHIFTIILCLHVLFW